MEYNTEREDLILKEYGRNVQKLVEHIKSEADMEKRSEYAHTIVDLMKQITPNKMDTSEEGDQKFWDDLYIISGFSLEVESEYDKPDPQLVNKRPSPMPYQSNRILYKHYGRNIELLIEEAMKKEDPEERENAIIYIGKLMKSFYGTWNKEVIDDAVILENINRISGGKLDIDIDRVKEDNLFERLYKNKKKTNSNNNNNNRKGNRGRKPNHNQRRRRSN